MEWGDNLKVSTQYIIGYKCLKTQMNLHNEGYMQSRSKELGYVNRIKLLFPLITKNVILHIKECKAVQLLLIYFTTSY